MSNPDSITRKDFFLRVSTLLGGMTIASTAGLLKGCGGNASYVPPTPTVTPPSAIPISAVASTVGAAINLPITSVTSSVVTSSLSQLDATNIAQVLANTIVSQPGFTMIFPTFGVAAGAQGTNNTASVRDRRPAWRHADRLDDHRHVPGARCHGGSR